MTEAWMPQRALTHAPVQDCRVANHAPLASNAGQERRARIRRVEFAVQ